MAHEVLLTDDAALDLGELYSYIEQHDTPARADYVLGQIEKALTSLGSQPLRGAYPKELLTIGIREYRELFFKPYRIIYRITGQQVCVLVMADGRRDMRSLLERRLLQP